MGLNFSSKVKLDAGRRPDVLGTEDELKREN